jgi:ferric-dicitrate binding protein FerR (iron transport regulator)
MGMQITLALVAGLLLGTGPSTPTGPAAKTQKDEGATVVVPENATITISAGTKISVRQVKTEQGKRIRVCITIASS